MAEKNTNNANNEKAGKGQIISEKSLKQIENPEKLNDYLRVTSAGVWLVLATVIVLLAGVVAWGFLGRIHSTVQAAVVTENGKFRIKAPFGLTGDQPQAVEKLVAGIKAGKKHQTLLGVTGSGKTFTMANVI